MVERSSRFVLLAPIPGRHTAEIARTTLEQHCPAAAEPAQVVSWDPGSEMAPYAQFKIQTGLQSHFCDPQSPWQRGSTENTNGLLRQYWPRAPTSVA